MIASASPRKRYSLADYLSRRVITMLALGFSSGLPFLLVGNTFGYWLRDQGTSLTAIGFISWVGLAYSLQFVWAPLVDRLPVLRFLGQRRGWLLFSQIFVGIGLFAMAAVGTSHGLAALGACALLVAFSAATQDIALSAWRIEVAKTVDELGLLTSAYTISYRVAVLCTDSLMLIAAQHFGWQISYMVCGAAMSIGLIATLLAEEPQKGDQAAARNEKEKPLWTLRGIVDAIVGPFLAFAKSYGPLAVLALAAIALYRMPDFLRGPVTNSFFHDIGMTKDAVGAARATVGFSTTMAGVAAGGILSMRLGFMRALLMGGVLQALGIAAHALLTISGSALLPFLLVMGLDDFSISFAGVTLVAYMSSLTTVGYTATQYALLSSAYALAGKFLKGLSGFVTDFLAAHFGLMTAYAVFFVGCGLLGIPALLLFALLGRKLTAVPAAQRV